MIFDQPVFVWLAIGDDDQTRKGEILLRLQLFEGRVRRVHMLKIGVFRDAVKRRGFKSQQELMA